MKIGELIGQLAALAAEHGDVEVYTETGCGCCIGSRKPRPAFSEDDVFDGYKYYNAVSL